MPDRVPDIVVDMDNFFEQIRQLSHRGPKYRSHERDDLISVIINRILEQAKRGLYWVCIGQDDLSGFSGKVLSEVCEYFSMMGFDVDLRTNVSINIYWVNDRGDQVG